MVPKQPKQKCQIFNAADIACGTPGNLLGKLLGIYRVFLDDKARIP
jgi:hypothetical protein